MLFNLTDTWFISKLGTEELAAIGFTFPVVLIVGSLAIGFSTGAASIITRALGANDRPLARRAVADGLLLTVGGTLIISALGYIYCEPLFALLGAEGVVLQRVTEYMQIWFLGAVLMILPPVSDGCLRAAGDMVRPLVVMCICAGVNVILDPIFIFGWGPIPPMEMAGAAIATLIARAMGMLGSLYFLHYHHHLIDWSRPRLTACGRSCVDIIRLGIPAAISQALNPLLMSLYLKLAATTGGIHAVAAMASGTRIEGFVLMTTYAFNIALIPITGQNFGAGNYERVCQVRKICLRFAWIYSIAALLFLLLTAKWMSSWFSEEATIVEMSTQYLIIAAIGHIGINMSIWMSQMMNIIGKPKASLALTLSRVFVYSIPLCWIGSHFYGFIGLVTGITTANLIAGIHANYQSKRTLSNAMEFRCAPNQTTT